jgi:copper transport protein
MRRLLAAAGLAAILLLAVPLGAEAHARLLGVLPAPSSTVPGPLPQVLLRFNEPIDRSLLRVTVTGDDGSALARPAAFTDDRTVTVPIRSSAFGVLVVTWLAVGSDAHPVQGQFVVGISRPGDVAALRQNLTLAATRVGSFESGAGSGGLTGVIEAGRSLEILLLYAVLGIVLLGVLVLRLRPAVAAGPTRPAARRAYRTLLVAGGASVALMPVLFGLYVARLTELISGVGLSTIVFSSIGAVWAGKAALWLALVVVVGLALRHGAQGRRQDRLLVALVAIALGLVVAFVAGTHVGTGSAGPAWLYVPMMLGHILLTAFWAGGLVALLLVVFPTRDPAEIWAAVSRFSRIMTLTVVLLLASGVVILMKLLANLDALWCTGYGLVAGFKLATVAIALVVGLVNNRMVAAHRRFEDLPEAARRFARRGGPSIRLLRGVVATEAALLLGALVLAAVLGETQLPPLFSGRVLPGLAQDVVQPGLFGSGCQ